MTELQWGALPNVRALAGGRIIRSPRLDELRDFAPLVDAGVTTVLDLRNPEEVAPIDLPHGVTRVACPVEVQDEEFMAEWGGRLNSPTYYEHAVRRWPELFVAVFRAIAAAGPGAILIHCAGGRDRTGLVVAMLSQLLGESDDEIVADYTLGVRAMNAHFAASSNPREPARDAVSLELWVAETSAALRDFLERVDAETVLLEHGLTPRELASVRSRFA